MNLKEKEPLMSKQQFRILCENFITKVQGKKIVEKSRGQKKLPKIEYNIVGKYVYLENYQSYLKFCNRDLSVFIKFMGSKLSTPIESGANHIRFRGNLKLKELKNAEKLFFIKEVLCPNCESPETVRQEGKIICFACNTNTTAVSY